MWWGGGRECERVERGCNREGREEVRNGMERRGE
jgi:hypothetical protein